MSLIQISKEIPTVDPDVLFHIGSFPVVNSFLMILLIILLLVVFAIVFGRKISDKPNKLQNLMEYFYDGFEDLLDQITGNRKVSSKIFPLFATLLVYLVLSNLIGLIPGLTSITYNGVSIFRTPTSDFNTTLGLSLALVFLINLLSIKKDGIFKYIGKFIKIKPLILSFKKGPGAVGMAIIDFLMGFLDIISEVAKVISLSLRLFGNIFAGEVLAAILLGALAYVLPAIWTGMNVLTGVVQALVFASLIAAYYSLALKEEEE
jgi:F-type H+-transporting ATPase subunit a